MRARGDECEFERCSPRERLKASISSILNPLQRCHAKSFFSSFNAIEKKFSLKIFFVELSQFKLKLMRLNLSLIMINLIPSQHRINFYDILINLCAFPERLVPKNKCNVFRRERSHLQRDFGTWEEIAARGMKGKKNGITFDT